MSVNACMNNVEMFVKITQVLKVSSAKRFVALMTFITRPAENHSGARGNILAGLPNIFTGPLW